MAEDKDAGALASKEVADAAEAMFQAGKAGAFGGKWQKKWAKKHKLAQRYAHEHNRDPDWFKHEKHVLICSWAGRPIFTRYGDETKLAAYLAVVSAIVSNFQRAHDTVRSILAGDHKFVFVLRGPIYMIAISKTTESVSQLRAQLNYTHDQIISVLTGSVHSILEQRPTYDIRNLMGGTESLLADLISEADRNPCFMLDSLHCLRMRRSTRSKIASVLKKARSKEVLFAIMLTGNRLMHMVHKDRPMHPCDMLILMNLVNNSQSLRSSDSWTPICAPKFSEKGYLYAYVCYIDEEAEVCLVLITADGQGFEALRESKQRMVEGFKKKNCMEDIREAIAKSEMDVEELDSGVAELRHFVYKSEPLSQIVMPSPAPPFSAKKAYKELLRRYQHLYARVHDLPGRSHSLYFEVSNSTTMLALIRPGEFQLYAAFTPLVSKEAAMAACNKALRWIKKEENTLFVL